jgi:hypothetical protein
VTPLLIGGSVVVAFALQHHFFVKRMHRPPTRIELEVMFIYAWAWPAFLLVLIGAMLRREE